MKETIKGADNTKMGIHQRLEIVSGDYEATLVEYESLKAQDYAVEQRLGNVSEEFSHALKSLREVEMELDHNAEEQRELERNIGLLREEIRRVEVER
jgi:chromosome segregation ATPase